MATGYNSTAIGANAMVTESNAVVLGSINGVNGASSSVNVGIGTTAPIYSLDVQGNNGLRVQTTSNTNNALQVQNSSGNSILSVSTDPYNGTLSNGYFYWYSTSNLINDGFEPEPVFKLPSETGLLGLDILYI